MNAHSRKMNTSTTTQIVTGPASPSHGSARLVTAPSPTRPRVTTSADAGASQTRTGRVRPAPAGPHHLDDHRQHGEEHDQDQHQLDVGLDERELAEPVPEQGHPRRPGHTTDHRVGQVPARVHPAHAGHDRDERAHDRHEPAEHDRPVAVAVEELLGLDDVVRLEQPRPRLVEHRRPGGPAHPVAGGVAQHRSPHQQGAHHPERGVDGAVGDEQARGEQQGVARKEEPEQQAALGEDDQCEPDQGPRAQPRQDRVGLEPFGAERDDMHDRQRYRRVRPSPDAGGPVISTAQRTLTRSRGAARGRGPTAGRARNPGARRRGGR